MVSHQVNIEVQLLKLILEFNMCLTLASIISLLSKHSKCTDTYGKIDEAGNFYGKQDTK